MKIYSNEKNISLISSMIRKGREPHSIVICGERGQGRKTLAKYIAAGLMCESGNGKPCGHCRSCRMLQHGTHPDFIIAAANENGNYQVDTIRELVADAVIKPNDSDFKVILIADLDKSLNTAVQVQNILLKLIEEPPSHCVIILTAVSKEIFLQTIISRVLCLNAEPCLPSQAEEWLTLQGRYPQEQILKAIDCCHGNFGRCVEFLEGEVLPAAYETAKNSTDAMVKCDEYEILRSLFRAEGKKAVFRQSLVFLSEIARDVCACHLGIESSASCYRAGAQKLSEKISRSAAQELYELTLEYIKRIDSNCNQSLTMNSLSGEIYRLISQKPKGAYKC